MAQFKVTDSFLPGIVSTPPAILDWLKQNAHCLPMDLVTSLVTAGHPSEHSIIWVQNFFESRKAVAETIESGSRDRTKLFSPGLDFGPLFPNYLEGPHGKRYPIGLVCEGPRVLHVMEVLTHEECDALIDASRASLTHSTVVSDTASNSKIASDVRSSMGTYFPRSSTPLIKTIEERIATLFRFPTSHAEPLQILNYVQNAEYKPHHDYFDETTAEGQRITSKSGNRVATLIMYLNEVALGGATVFPKINLQVLPRKGSVLYFDYLLPSGAFDSASLHGGMPVQSGEKWISTQWVRQLPYLG